MASCSSGKRFIKLRTKETFTIIYIRQRLDKDITTSWLATFFFLYLIGRVMLCWINHSRGVHIFLRMNFWSSSSLRPRSDSLWSTPWEGSISQFREAWKNTQTSRWATRMTALAIWALISRTRALCYVVSKNGFYDILRSIRGYRRPWARSSLVSESANPREEASTMPPVTDLTRPSIAARPKPIKEHSDAMTRWINSVVRTWEDIHVIALPRVKCSSLEWLVREGWTRRKKYWSVCMLHSIDKRAFRESNRVG